MPPTSDSQLAQVASWLAEARRAVVFTGAGMSTESGIPDFRSPGGIWSQTQPVYYDDFLRSATARHEYWRQKAIAHRDFGHAQPNPGHRVLAAWEARGVIRGIITQNIDGLHQAAGSHRVLELHGTARRIVCLDCGREFAPEPLLAQFEATNEVPPCPHCGGRLKSATVSFGQQLPEDVLEEAVAWSQDSDLFLALGSSLVVQPAAGLPLLARRAGARLVIINRDPTAADATAQAVLHAEIGPTLAGIEAALAALPGGARS